MKTCLPFTTGPARLRYLAVWFFALTLALLPAARLRADVSATALHITNTGKNTEALPTYRLDWDATSNSTYLVQSATSLGPGANWSTLDAVFVPDKAGSYQFQLTATDSTGLRSPPAMLYRLILPQPQISSVEPAIVPPGVPVDLYVLGQRFPTNALLKINGVTQTGTVYQSSSTLVQPSFIPDVAGGTYQVSLVVSGLVVSSFTVVCADPLANPEQVLQGPPETPPAVPEEHVTLNFGEVKVVYKEQREDFLSPNAQSDYSFDIEQVLNIGSQSSGAGVGKVAFNQFSVTRKGSGARTGKAALGDLHVRNDLHVRKAGETPREYARTVGEKNPQEYETIEFSGEVQASAVDLAIPGRSLDFILARTYHSRIGRFGSATNGWTFSYDVRCAQNGSAMDVYDGTGRKDTFTLGTNGVYTCPQFFREGTLSNNTFTLTFADTGRWVFNPFDGTASAGKLIQIINRNGDTMTLGYDTSGRLAQVVDDLGRTNTVAYNTAGQLASVTDFSGRTVRYEYDTNGDLVSVISPSVTGTPNGNDFPGGKTNRFTYSSGYANPAENHLLLSVIDASGETICHHVYQHNQTDLEFLRCISVQHGTNPPTVISYLPQTPTPANQFTTLRCIVNDPVGDVTECFYDARNRCAKMQEFTGRAAPGVAVTDTLNRPTDKLRAGDPDSYETRWSWNNDSLCTSEISPGGQQVRCVYQSDFDPATPARKRADCRVVRELASSPVDLDGDGVADTSERVSRFEYDPRFGSDPTASRGKKLYVGNLPFSSGDSSLERLYSPGQAHWGNARLRSGVIAEVGAGRPATVGRESMDRMGRPAINTALSSIFSDRTVASDHKVNQTAGEQCDRFNANGFDRNGFWTSATDPRGNVTTADYDTAGNCLRIRKRPEILYQAWDQTLQDFAYNPHGQVTAITNAPDANGRRRVDTFTWSQGQVTQCVVDAGGLALTENFEYDARGNLTRYVDPRTNDWLFAYNALDQLVLSSSATLSLCFCKIEWKYDYDANDQLVRRSTVVLDSAGNPQGTCADNFRYDALQRLTEIASDIDATHAQTNRFVYDANGQCVQELGPDAVSGADPHQMMAYDYDERGLLFQSISAPDSPLQFTTQCDYDANGNPTRVSEGLEGTPRVTTIEYDGFAGYGSASRRRGSSCDLSDIVLTKDQDTATPTLRRGGAAKLLGITLSGIHSTSCRPSKITDPMGNVTTFNYDANDNLKVVRHFGELNDVAGTNGNVRLAEARYEYDGLDRCFRAHALLFNPATQSSIGSGDAVSSCVLAPNGDCVSETDSLGRTSSFGYDTAGRSTSALSSGAIAGIVVARDACGNVTSSTETDVSALGGQPQMFTTTYAYDNLNRCVSASDNVGNTSTCAYDSLNRVVRETNPNGNDTTYAYDLLDNCLASADYNGSSSGTKPIVVRTSHATYDPSARCLTSTDPNGNLTSYAYDSLGHCTTVVHADGTRVQKKWLPANFRMIETDPNGTTVTNIYDLCDRLIHRDIATGGAAVATTTFETFAYDGCDRLVLANNDVSSLSFNYNSLGDCTGSSQDGLAQSATYDSEGNPLSLTYPGGRVVTYAYDALDQVTNVSTTANGVSHPQLARFAFAGPGRLAGIARDNGINTRVDWNGLVNPANSAGDYGWQEVSRVRDGTVASPTLVCDVTGSYSRTQSKLTRADAGRSSLTLTYDVLEQLVEASDSVQPRDTMYALDAAGNRSHVITNGVLMTPDYALSSALPPGDFFMNRYTTTPFGSQSYDANGNLIVRATAASPTFYHYDYADRLVEVDGLDTLGTLSPVATFTYDALGNRISKTTYPGVPAAPVTTQYVNEVVSYKDGEDGTMHTWPGNHKPGKMRVIEERVGGSVSRAYCDMTAFTGTGAAQYYHCDDLGNVLALTDAGGNVLERYAYDDYGLPQFLDANGSPLVGSDGLPVTSSPLGNPFLFQGMEWDGETGLLGDGGGNYFDPPTGRAMFGLTGTSVTNGKMRYLFGLRGSALVAGAVVAGNNPWSGGGGGTEMKNGTVKFFNNAKGFGMVVGGRKTSTDITLKGSKIAAN